MRTGPNECTLCSGEASVRNLLFASTGDPVLPDALASRPHLNVLNLRCQNLMELVLEPLYVQLCQWTDGAVDYPSDVLDSLWKELLKNHAHDRIQQEDELRITRILDAALGLLDSGLEHLVQRIDRAGMDSDDCLLTVVNTLPYERAEMVEASLCSTIDAAFDAFGLLDERGNSVEFDLLGSNDWNSQEADGCFRCIRFRAVVPAGGYRTFRLFHKCAEELPDMRVRPAPQGWIMQNEHMRVVVGADGQVDLLDSETGIESPDIFGFEVAAEVGDPLARPKVSILENRGVRLTYDFGVTFNLSLDAGSRHLTVGVQADQRDENPCLRLLVHTDVHTDEDFSSQPFDCLRRKLNSDASESGQEWDRSNCGMVSVRDWNKQMTLFNNGNHECEHLPDSRGTIALTLMNSENKTTQSTTAEQSLRQVSFELAIRPGQASEAQLMREMQCFLVPMRSIFDAGLQDVAHRSATGEGKMLPLKNAGMELNGEVVFSALKRSHDREGWILRFFNPAETESEVRTSVGYARVSDLDERTTGTDWNGTATVGAKEIITLRFDKWERE